MDPTIAGRGVDAAQRVDTAHLLKLRRRRRGLLLMLLASALGTLGAGVMSLAIFTDSDATSASFATGTVDISLNPSTLFAVTNMAPGDAQAATLAATNGGTAELRYAMTASATNADGKGLGDQLSLTIKTEGTSCAAFDGSTLYSGALSGASVGDTAQGSQAGDRTLAPGASENLCFGVSLPLATGNAFQDAATTTTFTFEAEQTANNP